MRYLLFDNMSECSEQAVQAMLPLVSEQRREQASKFRHVFGRFACLKSYVMLAELMHWTPAEAIGARFNYNEYGQPLLTSEYIQRTATPFFSISHCRHAIAVAVSESPVGIDVESIRNADDALIEHTMNAQELAYIRQSKDPSVAFIELWTRKESFLTRK